MLHDPNRDAYPPSKTISAMSMKRMMSLMTFGLYHVRLPDKSYYRPNGKTTYLNVPHGLYEAQPADVEMINFMKTLGKGYKLISIPGNIRMEKNYEMAIRTMSKLPGVRLIIAGSPSSSSVNVDDLKKLAIDLNVANRVTFIIKYLSDEAMSAVIKMSDVILLNYKKTFTSQSGLFNLVAPFKKTVVLSRTESALAATAARFGIGHFVDPDDPEDLIRVLSSVLSGASSNDEKWDEYLRYVSWENHVNIVINAFKRIGTDAV
jgi:glycosyltransferase involved in cell wall biosynthesis